MCKITSEYVCFYVCGYVLSVWKALQSEAIVTPGTKSSDRLAEDDVPGIFVQASAIKFT